VETMNFMITGVGGQGTILSSDILAAVGLAAGYDVKKSDILGLAIRGGAVLGHIRWGVVPLGPTPQWGEHVHSPIVPEGRVDYLVAFEILEGLRRLDQVRPEGTVLINQQQIHPVSVSSGLAAYPDKETADKAFEEAVERVYRIPGLDIAQELGNARVLNVVLLGALSATLPVEPEIWENVLRERVPARYEELNIQAFRNGRAWMEERT
jgi:indolepyruvate ferredoxin oxidoreductase, beta subunit